MRPLLTNHRVFTWFYFCLAQEPVRWYQKLAYILLISIMFIASVTLLTGSVLYSIEHMSVLEDFLFSFGQSVVYSGVTYLIIAALIWIVKSLQFVADLRRK